MRAIEKQHLFKRGTNLTAWVMTIMHHLYVNRVRASVRMSLFVELEPAMENVLPAATRADENMFVRDGNRALDTIPDQFFAPLWLAAYYGLRYADIATQLDLKVGTVRSRMARGREKLRRYMEHV